jgi:hypothetical protein
VGPKQNRAIRVDESGPQTPLADFCEPYRGYEERYIKGPSNTQNQLRTGISTPRISTVRDHAQAWNQDLYGQFVAEALNLTAATGSLLEPPHFACEIPEYYVCDFVRQGESTSRPWVFRRKSNCQFVALSRHLSADIQRNGLNSTDPK